MEIESKLINQGSYGCIYYPSLPFQIQRDKKQHGHNSATTSAAASATDTLRSKYVSKLQKFNFHSDFEDHIGRKIQEIPSHELFFVPVLKTYKIDLATIKEQHVTGCDAISKYIKRKARSDHTRSDHTSGDHHLTSKDYKALNKNFIIQKMKYINGKYLHRYLLDVITHTHLHNATSSSSSSTSAIAATSSGSGSGSGSGSDSGSDSEASGGGDDNGNDRQSLTKTLRKDERQVAKYRKEFKKDDPNGGETPTSYYVLSILFDLYERITDSIQLLIKYKIVHYDLKENNILIEKRHQLPYIIDFGLSIDVTRLQEHPWSEKQEDHSKTTIHSDILYQTQSSKIFQYNYLWRQHFYVHAPDYFLWPIEVHLMTYLINESDTLTQDNLQKICYEYISNNKAITYMSREFKKKMFKISVATFSRFIDQPREQVLNELLKYWDKWDIYAVNIMFLKTLYEMLFHRTSAADTTSADTADSAASADTADSAASTSTSTSTSTTVSLNEQRQNILDPHYSEKSARFHSKYKVKLKHKYNNRKILNTIQVMLRNIHPNPDKRMTPQETKAFFVSIFYEC
jgi:serine/threonine protein kinase